MKLFALMVRCPKCHGQLRITKTVHDKCGVDEENGYSCSKFYVTCPTCSAKTKKAKLLEVTQGLAQSEQHEDDNYSVVTEVRQIELPF